MATLYDPLEAYRADLSNADRSVAFGDRDSVWLAWAEALFHASDMQRAEQTAFLRRAASALPPPIFHEGLGPAPTQQDLLAWRPETMVVSTIAVADEAEHAGAYATATVILDLAQLALATGEPLLSGRLLARQARILRRVGNLDAAAELFGQVRQLAAEDDSNELRCRADVGMAIGARIRGNIPEARCLFDQVLATPAPTWELQQLHGLAHRELLVLDAGVRDFEAALRHGWEAYRAPPTTRSQREEVLIKLASVCLDSGQHRAALNGFLRALVMNLPRRARLAAIGGAAVAAAWLEERALVAKLEAAGMAHIDDHADQYETADLERALAQAAFAIGDSRAGSHFRRCAMTRAQRGRFHQVLHEAEALGETADAAPPVIQLSPEALAITRELETGAGATEDLAAAM